MFSQMCVKNSVHRLGRGHALQGACMAGGMHGRGGICGRGHTWQGACVAGGHVWQGGMCGGAVCVARGKLWQGRMHDRQHAWQGRGLACVAGEMATATDGAHPTGMHPCLNSFSLNRTRKKFSCIQKCVVQRLYKNNQPK